MDEHGAIESDGAHEDHQSGNRQPGAAQGTSPRAVHSTLPRMTCLTLDRAGPHKNPAGPPETSSKITFSFTSSIATLVRGLGVQAGLYVQFEGNSAYNAASPARQPRKTRR